MTDNISITNTLTSKGADKAQCNLFGNFCELMIRVFLALDEEEFATEAGWEIAFSPSASDADAGWKLVAIQAETVTAVQPISINDLLLHRMAGLMSRAVSATSIDALQTVRSRAMHCIAQAPMDIAPAVCDVAKEALSSLDQMIEHALVSDGDDRSERALPLAA
ncbi:hypothetical protein HAT86_14600 [Roseovarius gahaiensis]|uniref:Uncharacterized protein n=1 Tax=Roseovarius gahaiensis TaxID=2716691 RepID=A0A967BGD5_9RHOB|nr:hypothetical protein [Roseovarius gahaiensis]NHQ75681.1 hypothetical protein [Roseovarius gahaiensis]